MRQRSKCPDLLTEAQVARDPLTVREAAEVLGISESLVRDSINRAELKAYKYGNRKTVIYREDLEEFKESHRIEVEKI